MCKPHSRFQPTKTTRPQNIGYIAKLNKEKSEILNVYLDRKTAAHENGYVSSGLDTPVKNHTITNGNFYALFACAPWARGVAIGY